MLLICTECQWHVTLNSVGDRLFLVVLAFALSISCAKSLDLTGKQCPCVSGYICDESTNTCVQELPDAGVDADVNDPTPIVPVSLALGWGDHYGEQSHSCVVFSDGGFRCWGQSLDRQLGYDRTTNVGDDEFPNELGLVDINAAVTQVAAGGNHTCALISDGSVRCWGQNNNGQLGRGNPFPTPEGVLPKDADTVSLGEPATQIAAGPSHTCALLESGSVRCWGANTWGQLGLGHDEDYGAQINELPSNQPAIVFPKKVTQITAGGAEFGYGHTCALLEDGTVRCWGYNGSGELGYGNTTNVGDHPDRLPASKAAIDVGGPVAQIAAGGSRTCAVLVNGSLRCWGDNYSGELGYNHTNNIGDDEVPSTSNPVALGGEVLSVDIGYYHSCALLNGGSVRCWGGNYDGYLGYSNTDFVGGSNDNRPLDHGPVNVGGKVTLLEVGYTHSCVILEDHSVRCWGSNNAGELGYGHTDNFGDDEHPHVAGPVPLQ